jgi:hypothetical protein
MAEKQTYHENPYPFITLMDTLIPSHSFPHPGFWHTYCLTSNTTKGKKFSFTMKRVISDPRSICRTV